MSQINAPAFSICPLRSPVFAPPQSSIMEPAFGSTKSNEPVSILGPCLYAGCGMFVPTKVENGAVVDGMCGVRGMATGLGQLNANLNQLIQLAKKSFGVEAAAEVKS